jgi:hypothetical protein
LQTSDPAQTYIKWNTNLGKIFLVPSRQKPQWNPFNLKKVMESQFILLFSEVLKRKQTGTVCFMSSVLKLIDFVLTCWVSKCMKDIRDNQMLRCVRMMYIKTLGLNRQNSIMNEISLIFCLCSKLENRNLLVFCLFCLEFEKFRGF